MAAYKQPIIFCTDALGATLSTHLDKPGAYIGCLKSGEVFSEPTHKWYDPDWWKFGDVKFLLNACQGPFPVNMPMIDDVSTGSWFIGLQVKHVDESKFCCSSWSTGFSLRVIVSVCVWSICAAV
ncbi:hypothetical protein POTOM_004309 [Populus tomentosa]|uniref:Uncharacterized protein n=1 Tax=Populus tomentosa TaxID=118781 RepID=A0A8X8AJL6_POPTO|nr:hypothetical protein POTOM_004309 [Populus tomentosa]